MINSSPGWVLSPASDLLNVAIVLPEDTEELALTLAGKKRKLKLEHFEQLGKGLELTDKQIKSAFNRMVKNKPNPIHWVDKSFLSDNRKVAYKQILETRHNQLGWIK